LPGWWSLYSDLIEQGEWFREYGPLEDQAATFKIFEATLIPGLLQTEGYAHALLTASRPKASQAEIDRRVQFRIERQAILRREKPPSCMAVLDEAALRRQVGTVETMRAQLQHLINSAELPHVTIQVVPFSSGAYIGQDGAFTILGFTEPQPAANLYLEETQAIQKRLDVFNLIRKDALSKEESTNFIRNAINNLE
jgi:Domain of unknown function (DUF5753)